MKLRLESLSTLRVSSRGRIFSQAENEVGVSSLLARNKLFSVLPYTSCLAGNELVPKLTKNTAAGYDILALSSIKFLRLFVCLKKMIA
jgi:hypothetical protein